MQGLGMSDADLSTALRPGRDDKPVDMTNPSR
jgi:hypothetical protein